MEALLETMYFISEGCIARGRENYTEGYLHTQASFPICCGDVPIGLGLAAEKLTLPLPHPYLIPTHPSVDKNRETFFL